MKAISTYELVTDPQLLGLHVSPAQATLLRGIDGLSLDNTQLDIWNASTGGRPYHARPFGEVAVISGARGGKDSRIAAPVQIREALLGGHAEQLHRGERAIVPCVAQDTRASKITFTYTRDYLLGSPMLASMVEEVLATEIRLTNGVTIATFPCTLRSLRGWSIPAAVMSEYAFFRLEGQEDSDVEVLASIRRGTLNFANPRIVRITTPYLKGGLAYADFQRGFGNDDPDLLVWSAPSILMNDSLTPERLERERRLDPQRFAREYEAMFSDDLDSFIPGAWVDAAVVAGRHEIPARDGVVYHAVVDPTGAGGDAFPVTVVHVEGSGADARVVQDVLRSWKSSRSSTVDLEGVVAEIAAAVKPYRCRTVYGDRYSGQWVRQAFQRHGLTYTDPEIKGQYVDRSRGYIEAEPLFAQGRIEILDSPQLARELRNLERRLKPGGRAVVDHPAGGHDDLSNVTCLAAALASASRRRAGDIGISGGESMPLPLPTYEDEQNERRRRAYERQEQLHDELQRGGATTADPSSDDLLPAGWENPENWC